MKSAEYVGRVVAAYRRVLDAPPRGRKEALTEAAELLELSFGRPPTKGFLPTGHPPTDIVSPGRQGSIGTMLGRVEAVRAGALHFTSAGRLHLGDRLRVLPKNDQAGSGFTVTELRVGRKRVKAVGKGEAVIVPFPQGSFRPGDAVYRVGAARAFALSEEAGRRKLAAVSLPSLPVHLAITVTETELSLAAEAAGVRFRETYPVTTHAADTRPLSAEVLHQVFGRTGDTPFHLEEFAAGALPPVVIPPSRLKEIRRDCYARLAVAVSAGRAREEAERLTAARDWLLPALSPPAAQAPRLTVVVQEAKDVAALADMAEVGECILPLTPANVREFAGLAKGGALRPERLVWDLPPLTFEGRWREYRSLVNHLLDQGFRAFRLNNLGHFDLFAGRPEEDLHLVAGPRLYTMNSQAALTWRDLGAVEVTLSPEDDRQNLAAVLARDAGLPAVVMVYGPVELFLSRIQVPGGRPGELLHDDQGESYRLASENGLTVVTAGADFSLTGRLAELAAMGAQHLLIDCRGCGVATPMGRKVMAAVRDDETLDATSRFNFERGLA